MFKRLKTKLTQADMDRLAELASAGRDLSRAVNKVNPHDDAIVVHVQAISKLMDTDNTILLVRAPK